LGFQKGGIVLLNNSLPLDSDVMAKDMSISSKARVTAHEMGHEFVLSTRHTALGEKHDNGPYPQKP